MEYGFRTVKVDIEGESHSERMDISVKGFPQDIVIDRDRLQKFMDRRHGDGSYLAEVCGTGRREPDLVVWDEAEGPELRAHIDNKDVKTADYEKLRTVLRPGHSDLGSYLKYGEIRPGGGAFSGRMTAGICVAGGIAKQLLEEQGVSIDAYILSIGAMPCIFMDEDEEEEFLERLEAVREEGDSLGGIVGCRISGYPGGIGGPGMDGVEGDLARAMLAIPSAKGVEFGSGFEGAYSTGSVNNDEYFIKEGRIVSRSNRQGGISGGITTGMDISLNVAFKPVPSIACEQRTVDVALMQETTVSVSGRHDVCIVPRVLPVVEAMAALVMYDRLVSE